ncbi:MAG: hypothetical protein HUJ25_15950 [Crocinitomicaceae bacterium]|nr:hypothetical protein [Crocinitomicaceae bacterium]
MKTVSYLVILTGLVFLSCRKDPKIEIEVPYEPEPIELVTTPGSWWKYEWYRVDNYGNETFLGEQDCVFVVGDTLINGDLYTHYSGDVFNFSTPYNLYWRDSLHYIVTSTGTLLFSTFEQLDTLWTNTGPMHSVYALTNGTKSQVTVPAGNFMAYDREVHYYNTDGTPFTACDSIWVKHSRFTNGIGIISETTGFLSLIQDYCQYDEKRLVEYYIAP